MEKWIRLSGWIYVVAGVGLFVASLVPSLQHRVDLLLVPGAAPPDALRGVYASVAGGLTAGVGAMLVRVDERTDVRLLVTGLLTWFVIDTAGSLAHGSWQNALGNVLFLVVGLGPLLLARGEVGRLSTAPR